MGEPLPRPEHELPSYGRSLVLVVTGTFLVLMFLAQTIIALSQLLPSGGTSNPELASIVPLDFGAWLAAAETAAWRLKWIMIPITILIVFGVRKLYRSIAQSPARFCGLRYARRGYLASVAVPILVLILIGLTVPERLRQRQLSIDAGVNALAYTFDRAIFEYRTKFERVPNELSDLKQLPDADGSIAAALNSLDPLTYPNAYRPSAEVAAKQKPRTLRGAVIRNASINTAPDDALSEGLTFTNYELRLPGPDKLAGTEDDLLVRDGVITKAPETPRRGVNTSATSQKRQP
ncbi:MAG: hypothetical protein ABR556_12550 [Pyrinomonadaceae bacterium]